MNNPLFFLKSITDVVEISNNVLNNYFEALDYVGKIVESNPEYVSLNQDQIQEIIDQKIKELGIMTPDEFEEQFDNFFKTDS
jgi:ribosome assembly protein YihI (activator of Der GTPase)